MLPSRGITRSLPSAGPGRRQILGQWTNPSSRTLPARTGAPRQYSSLLRQRTGGAAPAISPFSRRHAAAATVALGGLNSSSPRAFSLWGWGSRSSASPDITASTASDVKPEAVAPVDPTPESVLSVPPTEPIVSASDVDLSSIRGLVNAEQLLGMEEGLGYLHAIGLNFGWGPTAFMQWLLENVHVLGGIGWGESIVVTALIVRAALFVPHILSLKHGARMAEMRKDPRFEESMNLAKAGFSEEGLQKRQESQIIQSALRHKYNAHLGGMLWSFLPVPFSFGFFRLLRNMCLIPVPGLENADFLWLKDLAVADPMYILPIVSTGSMIASVLVNMRVNPSSQETKLMKPVVFGVGALGLVVSCFFPAAINLMAATLAISTLGSTLILTIPSIRAALDLPKIATKVPIVAKPLYQPPREKSAGSMGIRERLTENLNEMKQGMSKSVSAYTGNTPEKQAARNRRELLKKLEDKRQQQEREAFEQKYKR